MSANDRTTNPAMGIDTYPGVANPTSSSDSSNPMRTNFVIDPTSEGKSFHTIPAYPQYRGAGAGPNFEGDQQAAQTFKQTASIVEGRPGIIESANIDPLNENSNKDDGWANTSQPSGHSSRTEGFVATATSKVADVANMAYEKATSQKS
ncbi:hypothetical protein D9757_002026 [Collybiopsis confluens]|uniref:Uncharacterized protein n=1 Tax=Collybiopsis confluens TaxID=2823264 RepID=A0A8H5MEU5_9AGAR|nr:hypothetical protein D9757_002026 [Collybiopsis confluens]